jgi:hypothetical protein
LIVISFLLATLPTWWQDAYWLVTLLPGFGHFRAAGRYTVVTSLGLALLAGCGLDQSISPRRFWVGFGLAVAAGVAAAAWVIAWWFLRCDYRAAVEEPTLAIRCGSTALAWSVGLAAVFAWRSHRFPGWGLVLLSGLELAGLYYQVNSQGPTRWGRHIALPSGSPIVTQLAQEPGVGLVAGPLGDLVTYAGHSPAYPYLGIAPPPPNYLLEGSRVPAQAGRPNWAKLMRRFGVTHGVWRRDDKIRDADVVFASNDPALDRLMEDSKTVAGPAGWKVVRYSGVAPPIWTSTRMGVEPEWPALLQRLIASDDIETAWYLSQYRPPAARGPRATWARVARWDGRTAVVEHDGTCELIIRRTAYPGWICRIDGGPEQPVGRADGGLQAIQVPGSGTSRVVLRYRPTAWPLACALSLLALTGAVVVLGIALARAVRARFRPGRDEG